MQQSKLIYDKFNTYTLFTYVLNTTSKNNTNNLLKSLKGKLLKNLTWLLKPQLTSSVNSKISLFSKNCFYHNVITVLSVPFYKNKLTQLLYLNMYILLTNYYSYANLLNVKLSTIPVNVNLYLQSFINLFYIKVRNH
jgi:hypothetical protein